LEQVFRKYRLPGDYREIIHDHLQVVGRVPLLPDASEFCLAAVERDNRMPEVSFYYPLNDFQLSGVGNLFKTFEVFPGITGVGEQLERLHWRRVHGFMHGSIDLVFRSGDRYYLADYKSNFLGSAPENYTTDKLADDMLHHHYYLQALIYSLALHRLLKTRLPDYSYKKHFGGVFYLYLRGMNSHGNEGVFFTTPDSEAIDAMDVLAGPINSGGRDAR